MHGAPSLEAGGGLPRRLARLPRHALGEGLAVYEARAPLARMLGLAGLRALPSGAALLIPRCRSVHTFGMRFALDVVFLDADGAVAGVVEGLGRRRFAGRRGASAVIETGAGESPAFIAALVAGPAAAAARPVAATPSPGRTRPERQAPARSARRAAGTAAPAPASPSAPRPRA